MIPLFENGDLNYSCFNIPSLVNTNNQVLALAEARRDSCDDTGYVDIAARQSFDGGMTWNKIIILSTQWHSLVANATTIGDACPVFINDSHAAILFAVNNKFIYQTVFEFRTGKSSFPTALPSSIKPTPGSQFIGTGHSGGIKLEDGSALFPVYTGGKAYTYNLNLTSWTWNRSNGIVGGEGQVAVLNRSHLYFNLRNNARSPDLNYRYGSFSTDKGASWSTSKHNSLIEPIGGCEGSTIALMGQLLYSGPDDPIIRSYLVLKSSNTGTNWRHIRTINSGPAGYSALCVINISVGILAATSDYYSAIFHPKRIEFMRLELGIS